MWQTHRQTGTAWRHGRAYAQHCAAKRFKIAIFDQYLALSRKRHTIGPSDKNSCAIYGMVPFRMTLSDLPKYSLTLSTRALSATADLLVLTSMTSTETISSFIRFTAHRNPLIPRGLYAARYWFYASTLHVHLFVCVFVYRHNAHTKNVNNLQLSTPLTTYMKS